MSEVPLNQSVRLQSTDTNKSQLLDWPAYSAIVNSNANQWLHFVGTDQFVGPGQQGAIVTLAGMVTAEVEWAARAGTVQPPASPNTEADIVFYSVWMPPSPGVSGTVQSTSKPYDGQAFHLPAPGGQATVTLPGVSGKRWQLSTLVASIAQQTGVASTPAVQVLDGVTVIWSIMAGISATAGDKDKVQLVGLAFFATAGADMTVRFSVGVANAQESIAIGAYLV